MSTNELTRRTDRDLCEVVEYITLVDEWSIDLVMFEPSSQRMFTAVRQTVQHYVVSLSHRYVPWLSRYLGRCSQPPWQRTSYVHDLLMASVLKTQAWSLSVHLFITYFKSLIWLKLLFPVLAISHSHSDTSWLLQKYRSFSYNYLVNLN